MKQVNPLQWGPSKILFRSTDSLDELLLVIAFIIKHSLEVLMFEKQGLINNLSQYGGEIFFSSVFSIESSIFFQSL